MKHPTETRDRAVQRMDDGADYQTVSDETGIDYNTLRVWKSRYGNGNGNGSTKYRIVTKIRPSETRTVTQTTRNNKLVANGNGVGNNDGNGVGNNDGNNFGNDGDKIIYTKRNTETELKQENETDETAGFTWKDAGLIAAVVILCAASILSVGLVLAHAFPVWIGGYMIAAVVCTAPVLLLLSKRVTVTIAWVTMILAFVVEVVCNAVAICVKIETETQSGILKAVGQLSLETVGNIAFAWLLGLALPALALCFEVLLLKNQKS